MPRPRTATVTSSTPSIPVSDQARSNPGYQPGAVPRANTEPPVPGQPYHSNGWGANGTHDAPPRSAASYRADVTPQDLPSMPESTGTDESRNGELALNTPSSELPVAHVQDVSEAQQSIVDSPDRISALEQQVANLGTLLSTVSAQLQQVGNTQVPPTLPGTANPKAPTPHIGSPVLGAVVPKVEGPVIPKPSAQMKYDDTAPRLPNQAKIPQLLPGEEDLSQAEYIEKHFRYRDLSIEQIAYMCHMDATEVIDVLKELGYQFVDGA